MSALVLRTALKTYPHTAAIKRGAITDPRVTLDCVEIEPIHGAFAPMAQRQAYDVSEMAIVTYLQARAYGKPLIMLPTIVAARLQQGCIVYNANHRSMTVDDLPGARVGVRAWSQTTGMWVRGILAETYGVDLDKVEWVTFEGGHLQEYSDPAGVTRASADQKMLAMLKSGALDAAIFGNDLPTDDGITALIPDAAAADQRWLAQHGLVPPNHVVVMRQDVAEAHPEALLAVYDMLKRGKEAAPVPVPANRLPTGYAALRAPLALTLDFCARQQLLPRPMSVDDLYADSQAILGPAAA